ncbi:MAG TPA: protein translocase subunit SecF [Halanaerobiales bacterium]|nr:protein translocase subunit SecF [Halanaerobiales bacterium]
MNILGKRKLWYTISLIFIVIGLGFLIFRGLNFGLDFQGGTLVEFKFDQPVSNSEVRQLFSELEIAEDARIQQSGEAGIHGVIIRTRELSPDEITRIEEALASKYHSTEILRTETVGPVIGKELRGKALWALLIASIAMVIYISIRFELRFAIVAIIALLHDVFIIMGIFAILYKEINIAFIAALLTVIGYSVNDTIVIFDRIRENMKLQRKLTFEKLANKAVVSTLSRSINTSVTTLITILAVYLFGGASIRVFMLALLIGVIAGTYSSIFIASSLLVSFGNRFFND